MAEYQSSYTGAEIDAGIGKANTAVQPADLSSKQDTLVSGTNIKTVNGTSILGSGNLATGLNYSTTEQNTGLKWINGKDIYQRTYFADGLNLSEGVDYWIDLGFSDYETIVKMDNVFVLTYFTTLTDSRVKAVIFKHSSSYPDKINVIHSVSGNKLEAFSLTIQYTKATPSE